MSEIEKASGKLAKIVEGLEFENDFGQETLGIGCVTQDRGVIAVGSLIGLFLGTSIINLPFGVLIAALGLNDWIALNRLPPKRTVDTTATLVDDEPESYDDSAFYEDRLSPARDAYPQVAPMAREAIITPQAPAYKPTLARSAYTLILDNPFQSLAIFGAQRTGKSYLAAILSQELHRRGIPVYAINLARFGEEDDVYWCHCVKSVMGDISSMKPYEANQLIKEAIKAVHEFYSQPNAILIFDEWAYAGNKDNLHAEALEPLLKLVSDKLGTLTSTGIKRGKAIWTIAPELVAGSLQKPALAIKKSALLYVTIAPGEFVEWKGNRIGFNAELFNQIKNNYSIEKPEGIFDQERICYLNNEWIEMGDLPPLDSSLRPMRTATPASPAPVQPNRPRDDKQQLDAAMVEALRSTNYHTLWEFAQHDLGVEDTEQIKTVLEAIADLVFDNELTSLKEKFRLRSKYDVRYSYADYSKKVAQAHQSTGNICCLCHKAQSQQIHHAKYLGAEDKNNLYPLCKPCHKTVAHSRENWVQLSIWKSHNTPEFESRLRLEYQYALQGGQL